ncbi:MAG: hypothetical protein CMF55_05475 [Legionellales bacterium]|nr:hypothetical protein [Legionellales bacterium]
MLDVKALECLGEGCTKWCYQHPDNDTQVIKIVKPGVSSQQARRYRVRIQREIKTLRQVRSIPELASYFPAYHGEIVTSLGAGYIFDKVDHLVDVFKERYCLSNDLYNELVAVIDRLTRHDIAFCPDLARNVFLNEETHSLYILDGLGCKYLIPATMSPFPRWLRRLLMARMMKKHIVRDLKLMRLFSVSF